MTLFHFNVFCCVFVIVLCYSDDFSDGYHYHRAFPQEVMVDVINNFGLSLLEVDFFDLMYCRIKFIFKEFY